MHIKLTESEIKNRLVAMSLFKNSYKGIIAIHEDYKDDQKFWGHLFDTFFDEKKIERKYTPFYSIAISQLTKNEDEAKKMTENLAEYAGYHFQTKTKYDEVDVKLVVCVDADSKYLYQEPWYLNKDYIFHTYTYSIENCNCVGKFLNNKFRDYSLNKIPTIDFVQLFKDFSLTLSTLFCYWIYNELNQIGMGSDEIGKVKQKEIMNMKDFCKDLKITETDLQTAQNEMITEISNRAKQCIDELEKNYGKLIDENEKQKMLDDFRTLYGIEEQDLFLYFKGHWVFEEFLLPIAQYQFLYLKKEFMKNAENEVKKNQINNQFGATEAESIAKIKTIVEKIHESVIHHKISPLDKLWQDLEKTKW